MSDFDKDDINQPYPDETGKESDPVTQEDSFDVDAQGVNESDKPLNEPSVDNNAYTQNSQDTYTGYNPNQNSYNTQPNQPPYNSYNQNPYQQPFGYPPAGGGYQGYNYNNYSGGSNNHPVKNNKKGLKVFFSVLLAVFVLAGAAIAMAWVQSKGGVSTESTTDSALTTGDDTQLNIANTPSNDNSVAAVKGALTPVQIADKVTPSIVAVLVYSNSTGSVASEGSGIIMSTDSTGNYTYIITCAHVISGSNASVSVQLVDEMTYDAEVVGYDSRTDVGVLKVKAKGLTAAEFGDSDALKVGEPVYAIGNPGGTDFFGSFTAGMVSAIDRSITSTYTMKCIQHDAAINPGNSGGALVNAYGQVIGINSLKISDTEYEGMGFAIPITDAKSVINDLIKYGYVPNRPMLGISYSEVSASQQYSMVVQIKGLPAGSLIIMDIASDSGLANTDARQYDMIIAVNGEKMTTADVLLNKIDKSAVGDTLTLTLCRISNNYEITEFDVKVKLVEDKGSTDSEEATTQGSIDDFFQNPFGF